MFVFFLAFLVGIKGTPKGKCLPFKTHSNMARDGSGWLACAREAAACAMHERMDG